MNQLHAAPGQLNASALLKRFYVTVFAYQAVRKRPKTSHTFAVFTGAAGESHSEGDRIEHHTISWLPADLNVNVLRLWPKAGHNLDLHTTSELARKHNLRVSSWGPYRAKQQLFDLALRRIDSLKRGELKFVSLDGWLRKWGLAINCIHAVSDLDPRRRLTTGFAHGESASKLVVEHLRPFFEKHEDTSWLRKHLGLQPSSTGTRWVAGAECTHEAPEAARRQDGTRWVAEAERTHEAPETARRQEGARWVAGAECTHEAPETARRQEF